jgi:hypothetical protein
MARSILRDASTRWRVRCDNGRGISVLVTAGDGGDLDTPIIIEVKCL